MSLVIGAREVEFDIPSGEVLKDESISCACGILFDGEATDVLMLVVNTASSQPRLDSINSGNSSVLRTTSCRTRHISKSHHYLLSYLWKMNIRKILHFLLIFLGSVFPSILLAFGNIFAMLCGELPSLVRRANLSSGTRWHFHTRHTLRSFAPRFFGYDYTRDSFSTIGIVCEFWTTYISNTSDPSPFSFFPCAFFGRIDTFKDRQFWFQSQLEEFLNPIIFMTIALEAGLTKMPFISFLRLYGFTNIADSCISRITQGIDIGYSVIRLRLGHLLQQVAHRFTSRGHGGAAPFLAYNSIMLEVA